MMLALCLMFITNGCSKDQPENHLIDVSFNISSSLSSQSGLKWASNSSSTFPDQKADYVMMMINEREYIINVSYIGEMPYTTTIKLPAGTYTLSEVLVYSDNHNSNSADDIVLAATPHAGSALAKYVDHPLQYDFTVSGSGKLGLPLEVLGYVPKKYKQFGFTYF